MAKSIKEPEKEVIPKDSSITEGTDSKPQDSEETKNNDSDNLAETVTVVAPPKPAAKDAVVKEAVQKKVKIHVTEPVDSIIAQVPYVYSKDQDVEVPADVAAILVRARKAYRI